MKEAHPVNGSQLITIPICGDEILTFSEMKGSPKSGNGAEYIYLFSAPGITKLGKSRTPRQRLKTLQGASGRAIDEAWVAGPFFQAHELERQLLRIFASELVARTEWIGLPVAEVLDRVSGVSVHERFLTAPAANEGLSIQQVVDVASRDMIALQVVDDGLRARDLAVAQRLGFARPRDVRKLIERNLGELERYGTCATVAHVVRGNPVTEYWLNEEQALLVATLSGTDKAAEVREALIRSFTYFRRSAAKGVAIRDDMAGLVTGLDPSVMRALGGMLKGIVHKALTDMVPTMVQAEISAQQYGVVRGLTAGDVLDLAGVENRKGLRGLPHRVSNRLRRFHAEKGRPCNIGRLGPRTAYIFDPATTREWLDVGGKATIQTWITERRGQGLLKLVR